MAPDQFTVTNFMSVELQARDIGDDRLQRMASGRVAPERFTHGTSAQRAKWFKRGYDTGDMTQGDTFNAPDL